MPMDSMPSSEFRRRYASLLRPTVVTVLGRPIGVWQPYSAAVWDKLEAQPGFSERLASGIAQIDEGQVVPFDDVRFGKPRPAPKRGR